MLFLKEERLKPIKGLKEDIISIKRAEGGEARKGNKINYFYFIIVLSNIV